MALYIYISITALFDAAFVCQAGNFWTLLRVYARPHTHTYVVRSKSSRPDQLFKVTEMKQLCYFST